MTRFRFDKGGKLIRRLSQKEILAADKKTKKAKAEKNESKPDK